MALCPQPAQALDLPEPQVPGLKQPENYLDLDLLGTEALQTWINYPGIALGDFFYPNWRGCGPKGELVDFFSDLIEVVDLQSQGFLLLIENDSLLKLDQGWVFYSYQLFDANTVDGRGAESLRLFFNVGKRPAAFAGLGAPHCRESHDLKLDPELLARVDDVLFVTPPYRAMRAGDTVRLTLDLYFGEGDPFQPLVRSKTLTRGEAGLPLQWQISASDLLQIEGGHALMSYSIEYADTALSSQSAIQTLDIVEPSAALLPALTIKDFSGGSLDPTAYPEGITLTIQPYSGIQVDDDVVLFASGNSQVVQALRADLSTLESGVLQFTLDQAWLISNNGRDVEFVYAYARQGVAGRSLPRGVILRRPLDLPPPNIKDAQIECSSETGVNGYMFAQQMVNGVKIRIPPEAVIGETDQVQMHWDGYGSTGRFIADPSPDDPRLFEIPPAAVPANMGKRLDVYYRVSPVSEPAGTSRVFNLEVRRISGGWPFIQIMRPRVTDARLPLASVPAEGAGLDLLSWTYMAQGQRVRIKAVGLLQSDVEQTLGLRTGEAEPLTEAEYQARQVSVVIPRAFVENLKKDSATNFVTVEVSFDEGASYIAFPPVTFTLVE
ncbi:hypothetical protein A584_05927 [Pseudomonas syringae pv. theae ICMP 3923]|nr:hypothetical protein [Pseudomonas syringae]EPM72241.1 hypothetical protein A584_05927 [Pseudomonas syringae pv. theae ICMP 3923]KPZ34292.1 hypothetical protein AN901_201058 [Pseudomonas syringae pv. theae]MBL3872391.1 hypothetical protein [Pseudomonas syringae pv. theae]GKQ30660.1 hypothetical protein PSTH68_14095 [Pseudomonas syringae pv. theae]